MTLRRCSSARGSVCDARDGQCRRDDRAARAEIRRSKSCTRGADGSKARHPERPTRQCLARRDAYGVWRGCRARCTAWPFDGGDGGGRALLSSRDGTSAHQESAERTGRPPCPCARPHGGDVRPRLHARHGGGCHHRELCRRGDGQRDGARGESHHRGGDRRRTRTCDRG